MEGMAYNDAFFYRLLNIKEYVRTLAELEDVTVVANILSDDFDE